MVDYSKWNNIIDSDDEDDQLKSKFPGIDPKTTRVINNEKGGKITIGPEGYKIHGMENSLDPKLNESIAKNVGEEEEYDDYDPEFEEQQYEQKKVLSSQEKVQELSQILKNTVPASKNKALNGSRGKYQGCWYQWSQDRYEVHVEIFISSDSIPPQKTTNLQKKNFQLLYDEMDRNLRLQYTSSSKEVSEILCFPISYAITLTGDRDNPYDDMVDWNLLTNSSVIVNSWSDFLMSFKDESKNNSEIKAILQLDFKKYSPIPNAFIWWKNIFLGEPEIDLTKIEGRQHVSTNLEADPLHQSNIKFLEKLRQGKLSSHIINEEDL